MKDAASLQLEAVSDATSALSSGLKKSIQSGSKEVGRFASSIGDFLDVDDLLKSIRQVTNSDDSSGRKTSVVHEPIDWAKYPPSAFKQVKNILYTSTLSSKCLKWAMYLRTTYLIKLADSYLFSIFTCLFQIEILNVDVIILIR